MSGGTFITLIGSLIQVDLVVGDAGMVEPSGWRLSRFVVLATVTALHMALIAMLLSARLAVSTAPRASTIEVMMLPAPASKLHAENLRPHFVSTPILAGLGPPTLISSPIAGSGSGPAGQDGAINWVAEASRAVNAFEIRRDRPATMPAVDSSPWAGWVPRGRPGDRVRTDSGDWIVWIDANCYQVAKWHSAPADSEEHEPKIYCQPNGSATPAR